MSAYPPLPELAHKFGRYGKLFREGGGGDVARDDHMVHLLRIKEVDEVGVGVLVEDQPAANEDVDVA